MKKALNILRVVFGFREISPLLPSQGSQYPLGDINERLGRLEDRVTRLETQIIRLQTDMNWLKRFMWVILAAVIANFFV